MPAAVASRYARALVDVVLSPTSKVEPGSVTQDLRRFHQALKGSPDLHTALLSPAVSRPRKRAVIDRLSEVSGFSKTVRNFLLVLIDHRRTSDLDAIIVTFEKLMDERLGVLKVEVTSARPLSDKQQAALVGGLESATGKKIWLNTSMDEGLLGGLIARIGSTVYDGSVRGKLDSLERRLRAG